MRICIDSSVLIPGLQASSPEAANLLDAVGPGLILILPRLIAQEVTRNSKTPEQIRRFYRLFEAYDFAFIVDEPTPRVLVEKYAGLGLPVKADAFIGAFAECSVPCFRQSSLSTRAEDRSVSSFKCG
ncbi:MAG TPA: hypothetical protein PKE64_06150 [Anaerolineae bacterium]|nr:hypothetical protein [Anaerolineae bacterium]